MTPKIRGSVLFALVCSSLAAAAPVQAADDDAELAIRTALLEHKDKHVYVRLSSGEELSGKVAEVKDDSAILAELAGREYFNAIIRLDRIDAVIVRVRQSP